MKAVLVPMYFQSGMDDDYQKQLSVLRSLLKDKANILEPIALGTAIPEKADGVLFLQLVVDVYRQHAAILEISKPIVLVTSEFGTFSMWDWEIYTYLREKGKELLFPYNLDQTKKICGALALKRAARGSKFLVYQDDPGKGFQSEIFKRFYWFEEDCVQSIRGKFGIEVQKKSFEALGKRATEVSDEAAEKVWQQWKRTTAGLSNKAILSAVKLYMVVKADIQADPTVVGVGINCLNESHHCNTTPCLAWDMLFEELGIIWICEADIMSLLTKYLAHKALEAPIMMTNIYPFLMGDAALKHEKIESFPEVDEPENHVLLAHCGYFGIVPCCYAKEWTLRPKVLDIVDENAHAIDATVETGPMTMVKIGPLLNKILVVDSELMGFVEYPNSHCKRGGVLRVPDGRELIKKFYSHHQVFLMGDWKVDMQNLAKVFELEVDTV
jgi:hypothetical protein